MSETKREPDFEALKKAVATLSEYFDSVQVFVSRIDGDADGGKLKTINWGSGNYYTRFGQVSVWLTEQKEHQRLEVQADSSEE